MNTDVNDAILELLDKYRAAQAEIERLLAENERLRAAINTDPEPDIRPGITLGTGYEEGYHVGFWDAVARMRDNAKEPKT